MLLCGTIDPAPCVGRDGEQVERVHPEDRGEHAISVYYAKASGDTIEDALTGKANYDDDYGLLAAAYGWTFLTAGHLDLQAEGQVVKHLKEQ